MAFVELGPVTSRVVQVVGDTMERMKPRNPHKIAFEVLDRLGVPEFGRAEEAPIPPVAPLRAVERADVEDMHRLRGALYSGD